MYRYRAARFCARVPVCRTARALCSGRSLPTEAAAATNAAATPKPALKHQERGELREGLEALRHAWKFLVDPADPMLRRRIGAAFALMIGAKVTTIQVPFLFKYAIDGMSDTTVAGLVADPSTSAALTPAALLIMYGATRAAADGDA